MSGAASCHVNPGVVGWCNLQEPTDQDGTTFSKVGTCVWGDDSRDDVPRTSRDNISIIKLHPHSPALLRLG